VQLCKVVGNVWATRKNEKLDGLKFLIVQNINLDGSLKSTYTVATDSVGAGVGEIVLTASGSSARQTELTSDKPVDTVVMAIVDRYDIPAA
jgi:microcompartment protein CcmK/EutM